MTDVVMEIPRCFSISIQSDVAWRSDLRDFTVPATAIALPINRSFSVIVVLPASGWEIMAKVRRFATSAACWVMGNRLAVIQKRAAIIAQLAAITEPLSTLRVAKCCLRWEPFKARRRPSPVTNFRQGLKNQQV